MTDFLLFVIGYLVSLFWMSSVAGSLFYGLPRSILAAINGELPWRASLPFVIAPIAWIIVPLVAGFLGAALAPDLTDRVIRSNSFALGDLLGAVHFVLSLLKNERTLQS